MKFLIIVSLFILLTSVGNCQQITGYKSFTGWGLCTGNANGVICLRVFSQNGHTYYFTVSPASLQTRVFRSDSIFVIPSSWELIRFLFLNAPYIKALSQAEALSNPIQDAGYTKFSGSLSGIDLTIDLCPSKRSLDREVFTELINELGKVERPVPVAVSITGKWMIDHPRDLRWLDSLVRTKSLSVVWINHSYNHFTYKHVPLQKNFLLAPGTNIDSEVLNNEKLMLEKGIIPSIFFRFPGLVSNREVYDRILSLGLIPVGSDAWLAKGQKPGNGSIVLIHANGNEPVGVKDFIMLLKNKQKDLLTRRWELFDLRESLIESNSLKY